MNRYAELTAPPPVEFVVEDANRVDTYGEGLFSRFVFGDVLEHLDDPELQIRLVERALRPGGRLVVSVPNKWAPANVAWWARRRMKGYALDEHRHEFTRLELGTLLGRYLTDIRFEYANVVPHWFGLPVDAMRRAERVALRRRPVLERLGWTMIATGTKR